MQSLFEKEKAYWLDKFDGEDRITSLAYTNTLSKGGTLSSIQSLSRTFPSELSDRIVAISGGAPLAVFMILLAGVKGLLYAYTNEERMIVGIPTIGSSKDGTPMMNPLLLIKNRVDPNSTFRTLLNDIKSSAAAAIEHQNIPFWNYTDHMAIPQDASGVPVIHTLVTLRQLHTFAYMEQIKSELAFHFNFDNGMVSLNVEYDGYLYDEETVRRLTAHLVQLFSVVLYKPELPIVGVDLLSESEKTQLLVAFNPATVEYPRDQTIHRLFEEQVERTPEQDAVVCGEEKLTYRELNAKANLVANQLRESGMQAEELVGIMAERSTEMIVGMLGVLKAGGAYVPIDPDYPEERIRYMLEDAGINLLLTHSRFREQAAAFTGSLIKNLIVLNNDNGHYEEELLPQSNLQTTSSSDLAYVIYTSGSTGRPKGVMVEHRNVVRLVKNTNYAEFNEQTRILQTGAVVFDASTFEIWGALLNGGQLYLVAVDVILEGPKLKQAIQKYGITTMWLTSPLFNQLSQQESKLFGNLRTLIVGGDVLSVPHINRVLRDNPSLRIVNGYGPTENTTFSTTHLIENEQAEAVPIGRPITHSTAYVVDRTLKLAPLGAWGELLVGGDGVARGYLNHIELTAEKFIEHPFESGKRCYRTGDIARWRADGTLEYKGRIDEQVKIRGYRIELAEVEAELLKTGSMQEAVVIAREDENGQKYLCAYFTSNREISIIELRKELLQELPGYMVPAYFVQMAQIPLNPNGKVDRRALPIPDAASQTGVEYEAPRTDLEAQLAAIWQDVLALPKVGVKDNFFEIGGHSLRATTLVSAIHKELNKNIQLRDVFQSPTIEALAKVIADGEHADYVSIPVISESEFYPVSSAQKRMYMVSQLSGAGLSYNMPGAMVLEGNLDREQLTTAFRKLIARHETLRTSFEAVNGEPVQRVHPQVEFAIEHMRAAEEDNAEIVRSFVRAFDLKEAPLMRVGLIENGQDHHILLFDMHHIISDGVSVNLLIQEFVRLYQSEELPPLRIQYKDYSAWQQEKAERDRQQEADWLLTFSGELPVLDIPTDFPRPATKSFDGSTYEFVIDKQQSDALKQIAAQTGSTLYMVLLAAYSTLLFKYSGQEDMVIGAPIAGRQHADLANLIGMFVNTLAIRHYPSGDKTFVDFVQEVKESTIKAFDNQDYPLDELLGKLNLKRDLSRNPLFDTAFVLQNLESSIEHEIEGLQVKSYPHEHTVAKFDLTLFASENEEILACSLEYAASLFKRETVERMGQHFRQLIGSIADNPKTKLSAVDIATEAEKALILQQFNDTTTDYPREKTIHELFEEQAARTP
ncbi:amino acid adenylation domain-containing protein, partial [Paenibacillus sp. SI8]|uniref:amino acid adenylation domain-containing protein n=1 Tax=unclassified Paenibacillus TaxID=185978 RepID=UPI00346774CF